MRAMARWAAALVLVAACASVANESEPLPEEGPDIVGTVTERREVQGGWVIRVQQDSTRSAGYPRADVAVGHATRVLRRNGDRVFTASGRDLHPGTRVRAWFAGPVTEALTVRVQSRVVLIES
jgi:hypothetical protein